MLVVPVMPAPVGYRGITSVPVLNPASHSHDYVMQYRYQKNKTIIERCKLSDCSQAQINCQWLDKAKLEVLSFETDTFGQIIAEENHGGLYRYDYDPLGNLLTTYLSEDRQLNAHNYGSGHISQLNFITNSGERHILAEYERDRLHREVRRTQSKLHQDIAFDSTGRIPPNAAG